MFYLFLEKVRRLDADPHLLDVDTKKWFNKILNLFMEDS
jgi:hypothetical protein